MLEKWFCIKAYRRINFSIRKKDNFCFTLLLATSYSPLVQRTVYFIGTFLCSYWRQVTKAARQSKVGQQELDILCVHRPHNTRPRHTFFPLISSDVSKNVYAATGRTLDLIPPTVALCYNVISQAKFGRPAGLVTCKV